MAFDIDADGILHVSAKDKATGREQKITITASSGLSSDEIDRMVREAEQHAAADRERKEQVEARNQADSLAYSAEKTLRDLGDKVPADVRASRVQDPGGARRLNAPTPLRSASHRRAARLQSWARRPISKGRLARRLRVVIKRALAMMAARPWMASSARSSDRR